MFKRDKNETKVELFVATDGPTLYIEPKAMIKMRHIIQECKEEVGWLGSIKELDKDFILEDVFIFEQEVHAATCEITPDGLDKFANEVLALPNGIELINSLKFWGHSHVNMSIYPSGQDDNQLKDFAGENKYYFRAIGNKKDELKIDFIDYESNLAYININYELYVPGIQEELESLKKDIKEKVKPKSYGYTAYTNTYGKAYTNTYGNARTYAIPSVDIDYKEAQRVYEIGYKDGQNGVVNPSLTFDLAYEADYEDGYEDGSMVKGYQQSTLFKEDTREILSWFTESEINTLSSFSLTELKNYIEETIRPIGWEEEDYKDFMELLEENSK